VGEDGPEGAAALARDHGPTLPSTPPTANVWLVQSAPLLITRTVPPVNVPVTSVIVRRRMLTPGRLVTLTAVPAAQVF
jgi:hypothetical protein